jgi:hypothetical protein
MITQSYLGKKLTYGYQSQKYGFEDKTYGCPYGKKKKVSWPETLLLHFFMPIRMAQFFPSAEQCCRQIIML